MRMIARAHTELVASLNRIDLFNHSDRSYVQCEAVKKWLKGEEDAALIAVLVNSVRSDGLSNRNELKDDWPRR
jgi:hypothetical protein